MELRQFFVMVKKRLASIILIPLLASTLAAVLSAFFMTPIYEASSTLYIVNQNTNSTGELTYEEMLTNQQLVKDYRELIKSKLIIKKVLEELKIQDINTVELTKRITISSKNDTRVLEIKVEDKYPVRCMELSNKICEVFIEKATDLAKIDNVSVVDTAEVPDTPVKPQPLLYTAAALFLSLMVTIGIFYLLELINETIKTSEDIETYLGLNVLGTIPSFNIK